MKTIIHLLITAGTFLVGIMLAIQSLAVGFKLGNEFKTQDVYGYVSAYCDNSQPGFPGGPGYQTVSCSAYVWSPDIADYFVGPQAVIADKVALTATHESGSTRTKDSAYDSPAGQSKSRFNLGISTLTQKPLLKSGKNTVHYVMTLAGAKVTEGNFVVNVQVLPQAQCPHGYYSGYQYDCRQTTLICDRYFEDNNYCQ